MKGSKRNEELISDLGGRRHLKNHGVSSIHCNDDDSITLIFEGYARITISKNDNNTYNVIRPSIVYEQGIGLFENLSLFEAYDTVARECNISLWALDNKSKGQLFSEKVLDLLGGIEYLKKNYTIRHINYYTDIEKINFTIVNALGVNILFQISKSDDGKFTINKKVNVGLFNKTNVVKDVLEEDLQLNFKSLIAEENLVRTRYSTNIHK